MQLCGLHQGKGHKCRQQDGCPQKYILLRDQQKIRSERKQKSSASQPAARHPARPASPPFTQSSHSEPATAHGEFLDLFLM